MLRNTKVGLVCSVRCPGKLILRTYDLVRELRDSGVTLVGGFHSPMERECLRLVLRGGSPVIVCPARSVENMRIPSTWKGPIQAGRLLVIADFPTSVRRVTRESAVRRNTFVASIADTLFVAFAEPGGSTDGLCRSWLKDGKRILTFGEAENNHLIELGAQAVEDAAGVALIGSAAGHSPYQP